MSAPETCPNCGADVPRGALACPECGADERTGWNDRADSQRTADRLGIPDDEFNYDEFVKEEFGERRESRARTKGVNWLMDYLKDGTLSLREISVLVLDEVDRMLDMGFLPVVKDIIARCPKNRQTLFFSATVPPEIQAVASFALRNPTRIEVGVNRSVNQSVNHAVYPVSFEQKFDLLVALLAQANFDSVLVFSRTKHGADRIARRLKAANHSVAVLHANRSQNQRIEALAGFKSGKYEIMVATDIAARGIDVAGVTHVINYDVPENPEDYVHRIGRTGRAQAVGDAFTLVTPENAQDVRDIERFIGQKIPELRLEGFDYKPLAPRPPQSAPERVRGMPAGTLRPRSGFRRFRSRR